MVKLIQCATLRDSHSPQYSIEDLDRIVQDEYPDGTTEHGAPAPTAQQVQAALVHGLAATRLLVVESKALVCPELIDKLDAELGQEFLDKHNQAVHIALALIRNPVKTTPWFGVSYPYSEEATS